MKLGTSFSHLHLKFLNLSPIEALKEFGKLGLQWIRLGCYWNEIENKENVFDFKELDQLVKMCGKYKINIVMTVGMKAPRYPEYYLPNWVVKKTKLRKFSKISSHNNFLHERTVKFIDRCIRHFKNEHSVRIWQVENEPLDPSGKYWWRIDKEFLKDEVRFVRQLDPKRKILINVWGNELNRQKLYKKAVELSDVVGFDIYPRCPIPFLKLFKKYIGPLDSKDKIKSIFKEVKNHKKGVWITELQAEPWEPGEIISNKNNPLSFLPEHFEQNLKYAADLEPDAIFLWGFEYWLWKRKSGDKRYWKKAKEVINKYK